MAHGLSDDTLSASSCPTGMRMRLPLPLSGRLPSYIADHRKRLRDRFMRRRRARRCRIMNCWNWSSSAPFPRQDVKPLARLLLDTFGDFNRVISASPARLQLVKGVGDAVVHGAEDGRGCRPAHDARPGDATARPVVLGCAAGLLPHHHGPPRNRTVPHPVS